MTREPATDPDRHLQPRRAADGLAALAFVTIWAYLFRDVLSGRGLIFDGEIHEILFPIHRFLRDQLLEHHRLPLWNPHLFFGYPWLGAIQAAPLYPIQWLFDLSVPAERGLSLDIALHFLLAGASMYTFARKGLRLSPLAGLGASGVFAFNGHMVGNLAQLHNHATLAWAPLVLLAIRRISDRPTPADGARWAGIGALSLGLSLLGGMTQQSLYLAALFSGFALWSVARAAKSGSSPPGSPARSALWLGLLVSGGAGIFAAQWNASRSLLAVSARSSAASEMTLAVAGGSLTASDALGLLFPNLVDWGSWGALNTLFVGVVPLAVACAWGLASIRRGDGDDRFFALTALVSIAFALGDQNPVVRALYALPWLKVFHDPVRAISIAMLAIAVLFARAVDGLERGTPGSSNAALGGLLAGALLVGAIRLSFWAGHVPLPDDVEDSYPIEIPVLSRAALLLGSLCVAAASAAWVMLAARGGPRLRRWAPRWLVAVSLISLAWFSAAFVRTETPERVASFLRGPAVLASLPKLGEAPGWSRLANLDRDDVAVEPFESEFRWAATTGFSSLVPREVLEFTHVAIGPDPLRLTAYSEFTRYPALLDLAAVRHLLARRPFLDRGEPVSSGGGFFRYENRSALPRVFLVPDTCIAPDAAWALDVLASPGFDPRATLVLSEGSEGKRCEAISGPPPTRESPWFPGAEIVEDEPDRLRIAITRDGERATSGGSEGPWLLVLDRFDDGWKAHGGGADLQISRADLLFRAIRWPAGEAEVELRYQPKGQRLGFVVSVISFASALTLALWPRSRTRAPAA